jgi:hypothetical protein
MHVAATQKPKRCIAATRSTTISNPRAQAKMHHCPKPYKMAEELKASSALQSFPALSFGYRAFDAPVFY